MSRPAPLARRSSMLHDIVNVGALQPLAQGTGLVPDFKAFQLPVAIIFAVTGVSRASALVTDIQNGYFDRLLLTPVRRPMLLLGLMAADLMSAMLLAIPVTLLGLVIGVDFVTGLAGMLAFLVYGALWGLAFAGFPYAIALKTGNPAAVNASFILFFPFAFLTTTFLPEEAMTGWLATIATYNPVTYVLEGMRALISEGWLWDEILPGLAAIAGVIVISFGLASMTMRGRIQRG